MNKVKISVIFAILIIAIALIFKSINKTEKPTEPAQNTQTTKMEAQELLLEDNTSLTKKAVESLAVGSAILDPKNKKELDQYLDSIASDLLTVKINYSKKEELKIVDKINYENYKKVLSQILKKLLQIKENEFETIAKATVQKKLLAYETLKKDIEVYKAVIKDLKQIKIDEKLAPAHLYLINSYEKLVAGLELIVKSKNDIMSLYPGLKAVNEADAEIKNAFDTLKLLLEL